jgi:ribose-phosphate pyrophosphokinase
VLSGYLQNELGLHGDDLVVVSPDAGRIKTAERLREVLHADLAVLYKRRSRYEAHKIEEMTVVGDVQGRPCVLVDDMIDTATTIAKGANALAQQGAGPIYAAATHPVLSGKAVQNLEEAPISEVVVTNTMPIPEEKRFDKLKVLSIAPLIADAPRRVRETAFRDLPRRASSPPGLRSLLVLPAEPQKRTLDGRQHARRRQARRYRQGCRPQAAGGRSRARGPVRDGG